MVVIMPKTNIRSNSVDTNCDVNLKQSFSDMSFVDALKEKYIDQDEFDNQIVIPKDKSISTEITFVGFGTVSTIQKQLKRLTSIDLSNQQIVKSGSIRELEGMLHRVTLLNLAGNRLNWQEIIDILYCLPNLKEIIITSNDLRIDASAIVYPRQTFKKLTSLTMGKVSLSWNDVVRVVSSIWSGVEQIDLWDNQLDEHKTKLSDPNEHKEFTELITGLRFSQNNYTTIHWLSSVGAMENLRELDLSHCKLESLSMDAGMLSQLNQLLSLNISYNNICEWRHISALNVLPKLTSLICNDNPILITEKLARPLVIARLSGLRTLNREEIVNSIRRDSEILYLRKVFPEYQSFKAGNNETFPLCHPRYEQLAESLGLPEDPSCKKPVDKYVSVNLYCEGKHFVKKLPHDMRVSNLQMLCKRLFRFGPSCKIEVLCCATDKCETPTSYLLDKDSQTLHFFSVKENYNLLIKKS